MVAPSKLGIRQIWVDKSYRRHGVATIMLDNIRRYHTFGHNYDLSSVAFSQPTQDGKNFAFSYARNTTASISATSTASPTTNNTAATAISTISSTTLNKRITITEKENDVNRGDEEIASESFIYVYA